VTEGPRAAAGRGKQAISFADHQVLSTVAFGAAVDLTCVVAMISRPLHEGARDGRQAGEERNGRPASALSRGSKICSAGGTGGRGRSGSFCSRVAKRASIEAGRTDIRPKVHLDNVPVAAIFDDQMCWDISRLRL